MVVETQINRCNRYEGKSETHEFIIMDMAQSSYVGYKKKGNKDYIIIEADKKDIEMFIKIIKATKIKVREMVSKI